MKISVASVQNTLFIRVTGDEVFALSSGEGLFAQLEGLATDEVFWNFAANHVYIEIRRGALESFQELQPRNEIEEAIKRAVVEYYLLSED